MDWQWLCSYVATTLPFVGGIMIEVVIVMVLLSRVLPYSLNRWANIIGGALSILLIIAI